MRYLFVSTNVEEEKKYLLSHGFTLHSERNGNYLFLNNGSVNFSDMDGMDIKFTNQVNF